MSAIYTNNQIKIHHPPLRSLEPRIQENRIKRIAKNSFYNFPAAQGLIRYFAEGAKLNQNNPHLLNAKRKADTLFTSKNPCSKTLTVPDLQIKIGTNANQPQKQKKLEPVCVTNGKEQLSKLLHNCDSRDLLPRVLLGIFEEGDEEKIKIANDYLKQATPFKTKAKGWTDYKALFHSNDDFTITILTRILYRFGNDPSKIYPETKRNLLKTLLTFEGRQFDDRIPNTAGIGVITALVGYDANLFGIRNTENHILMINGSAYLKNQFMKNEMKNNDPKYNNSGSVLEQGLGDYLDELYNEGLIEFNSIPYSGYTVDALLNLFDFASEPIKTKAGKVLDLIFTSFALHSTAQGQSFRPFGRQYLKVANKDFVNDDGVRAFLMPWLHKDIERYYTKNNTKNSIFALGALTTGYRPPEMAINMLQQTEGFLAKTGHRFRCAEITYKGSSTFDGQTSSYLISGGGNREKLSFNPFRLFGALEQKAREIISRPITLIIEGKSTSSLYNAIFLGTPQALKGKDDGKDTSNGPGIDSMGRNNSGTYHNFACAKCPVQIPKDMKPSFTCQNWSLYEPKPGLTVAVYSTGSLGMFAVYPDTRPSEHFVKELARKNPRPTDSFTFPKGFTNVMEGNTVHFDVNSGLDEWVIKGVTLASGHKKMFNPTQRDLRSLSPQGRIENKPGSKEKSPLDELYPASPKRKISHSQDLGNIWKRFLSWISKLLFTKK